MATVANLPGGIRVIQYYKEHPPPHFHARQGSDEVLIVIATLAVMRGRVQPPALRSIVEWAAEHRDELRANWLRSQAGKPMEKIG